jgi:hypothetical protein
VPLFAVQVAVEGFMMGREALLGNVHHGREPSKQGETFISHAKNLSSPYVR